MAQPIRGKSERLVLATDCKRCWWLRMLLNVASSIQLLCMNGVWNVTDPLVHRKGALSPLGNLQALTAFRFRI